MRTDLLDVLSVYPRIKDRIKMCWGTVELKNYLDNLLQDNRDNTRQGFPRSVCFAIVSLANENTKLLEDKGVIEKIEYTDFVQSTWKLPKNF